MKEEKVVKTESGGGGNVCAVCGDKATGIHYRVQSCEGCKGFWRRTIQRNMGNKYTCKVWTETCPVTPETRGRCQRCRYLACVGAGMVADLVMADKERLSRLRLVDQNREKRRQEQGLTTNTSDDKVEQDGKLLELLHTLYGQIMLPATDPASVSRAAFSFCECLLFQLMGQRADVRDVVVAAHAEVAAVHLVTSRPALELMMIPLMSELSVQVSSLGLVPSEIVLIMAMAATRPRLTWPVSARQELSMLWELLAGTVRRCVNQTRMSALLQLIHQVQAVTFYIGHGPLSVPGPLSAPQLYPPPPTSVYSAYPGMIPTPAPPPPPPPQHHLQYPPYLGFPETPLPPPPVSQAKPAVHAPVPLYHKPESLPPVKQEPVLNTPKLERKPLDSFYSPPQEDLYLPSLTSLQTPQPPATGVKHSRDDEEESPSPPSSVPLKKRKCNLYDSGILQQAINYTLSLNE